MSASNAAEVNEDTENSKGAASAWRGAVKIYNYAARLDPADVNYHVEAIKALLHAGESDQAIKRLDDAVIIMLHYNQQEQAEAIRGFRKMILQQL